MSAVTDICRRIVVTLIQRLYYEKAAFSLFKSEKKSLPKTEGKSFLFHIGNEFPNIITITSVVDFYVKAFLLRNL